MSRKALPVSELQHWLYYDETSPTCLRWKHAPSKNIKVDAVAGALNYVHGGASVGLNKTQYAISRVVWSICKNEEINEALDVAHYDSDRHNFQITNLYLMPRAVTGLNRNTVNTATGYHGVVKTRYGRFAAVGYFPYLKKYKLHLGCFATAEEAAARVDDFNYHNWGSLAVLNCPNREPMPYFQEALGKETTSSQFWGVTWSNKAMSWSARVRCPVTKKNLHGGCFRDEIEAARAADKLRRQLGVRLDRLNFPDEE